MRTVATIMNPDGTERKIEQDWPNNPGFHRLDAFLCPLLSVESANFEHVSVLNGGTRADMFVDELGLSKGLPRNEKATSIYRAATLATFPKMNPEKLNHIVGVAIIFDRRVWF